MLDLELCPAEAAEAWGGFLRGLVQAVAATWPGVAVPRCTGHNLRTLLRHAPTHAREEGTADPHRIVSAVSEAEARSAHWHVGTTWKRRAPKVGTSLLEAGEERLSLYRFPARQGPALRPPIAIERLHAEFRRGVKTQALPHSTTAKGLLFGLLASLQAA